MSKSKVRTSPIWIFQNVSGRPNFLETLWLSICQTWQCPRTPQVKRGARSVCWSIIAALPHECIGQLASFPGQSNTLLALGSGFTLLGETSKAVPVSMMRIASIRTAAGSAAVELGLAEKAGEQGVSRGDGRMKVMSTS